MIAAILFGLAGALLFRCLTDTGKLRTAVKKMQAHFMEFRLFADDPVLVWQAQKAVIRDNFRIAVLTWKPVLILTVAMVALYPEMHRIYGYGPLPVGGPTIVTAQLETLGPRPSLEAPGGIQIETPAVRILAEKQFSWRIRRLEEASTNLTLTAKGHSEQVKLLPGRQKLSVGSGWVEINYPTRPWLLKLGMFSAVSALLAMMFLNRLV